MKKVFLLILYVLLNCKFSISQTITCGTTITSEQINFENLFSDSVNNIIYLNRKIHINVYITKDKNGNTNFDIHSLNQAINTINILFDKIKVKFEISSLIYIDNYHYDVINENKEKDLLSMYYKKNLINIFIVKEIYKNSLSTCAYAYYPSSNIDAIFIAKNCFHSSHLIEQIGHLLNLYHTHETAFGKETVKRTNCKTKGDKCCDTPADPNLSLLVNAECKYTGTVTDENNELYNPTVNNYMSASLPECKCYFSDEQYLRMINCLLRLKNYLW